MKQRAYLETTIISYLAARSSRSLLVAAHQQLTRQWWNTQRLRYELFASELVAEEAGKGDRAAAQRRNSYLSECKILEAHKESIDLAEFLVGKRCVPKKAAPDALHIALATVNQMDYLVTWNCSHINNAARKNLIQSACAGVGFRCPTICTPEELMGDRS